MSTRPEASPTDTARLAEASRVLAEWFETDAPPHEPADLLSATLWRTARTRRRAAWRNPERWLPRTIALRPAVLPRVTLVLALMVTLVIAVGGALYFASSPPTTPRPLLSPGPSTAAMPALTSVTAISAGSANCALVAGGRVRCSVPNGVGQLGDGTTVDSTVPVEVSGIEGATVLVGGPGTTCAVVAGGVVRCWGSIGSDFNDSRLPIDMPELQGATSLVMRTNDPCIPLADGALRCQKHIEVPGLVGATTIIGTDQETTCALMADGRVECWGRLRGGSLGDGLTEESQTPIVAKGVEGATAIALGQSRVCALVTGGRVICWGDTNIADGVDLLPTEIAGVTGATALEMFDQRACALVADGTVRCWGPNSAGELGDGTRADSAAAVEVAGLTDVVALAGDCALTWYSARSIAGARTIPGCTATARPRWHRARSGPGDCLVRPPSREVVRSPITPAPCYRTGPRAAGVRTADSSATGHPSPSWSRSGSKASRAPPRSFPASPAAAPSWLVARSAAGARTTADSWVTARRRVPHRLPT